MNSTHIRTLLPIRSGGLLAIRNKRWFAVAWSVVTLVFLAIVLLGLHIHNSDSARAASAADNFMLAVQSDDPTRAYGMGALTFRRATNMEALRQIFDQLHPYVAGAVIDTVGSEYDDSSKTPRMAVVYRASNGQRVAYVRLVMVRPSGTWQVQTLQTSKQPLSARLE